MIGVCDSRREYLSAVRKYFNGATVNDNAHVHLVRIYGKRHFNVFASYLICAHIQGDIVAEYVHNELFTRRIGHINGDIERVRRALNHGGIEVTMIYAMADKQLRDKGRRRRAKPGRKRA